MQFTQSIQKSFYRVRLLPKLIFIGMFMVILAACSGNAEPAALPTLVEVPTEEIADTQNDNSQTQPTEVVIVTDEPGQTEVVEPTSESEAIAEANNVNDYQNEDETLRVIVTTVNTAENTPGFPEAPDGQQYILLTTNLHNFTGEELYVDATSLTLIDVTGNRYAPIAPDDYLVSPIFDITLDGATAIVGSVRFEIPADAVGESLQWCPYSDCAVLTLQVPLP